jgi:hypothetical protein
MIKPPRILVDENGNPVRPKPKVEPKQEPVKKEDNENKSEDVKSEEF